MSDRHQGLILLTFDDRFTDGWVKAIPLFSDHAASVTFFIDHFHQLSSSQLDDLHCLAEAGHEIGCHGLMHASATELVAKLGPDGFLAQEIDPALQVMRSHGFLPRSYAYPRSQRSAVTDAALWSRFTCLRAGLVSAPDPASSSSGTDISAIQAHAKRRLMIARSIDQTGASNAELDASIAYAADNAACVALYAHAIAERASHHHVSPQRLEHILKLATRRGIGFERFSINLLDVASESGAD